jgi:hypothetical protein
MFPKARQTDLSVRSLPDETLVYDLARRKAHCLNATAALVWRHCDGRTSLADLARIVREELQVNQADAVVRLALEQLSRRSLLERPITPLAGAARFSRRQALKKLVLAAVVLPLVITVSGQAPAVHASPRTVMMFLGKPCVLGGSPPQCGPYQCVPPPTKGPLPQDRNLYDRLPQGTGICG